MYEKPARCFSFLLAIGIVLCFSETSVYPQMGRNTSGTGGKHTIQGNIYLPSGVRTGNSVDVKLESNAFSSLSVVADGNGTFSFTNLTPGSYTIIIDAGENFQTAREYVYIDDTSSPPVRSDPNFPVIRLPDNPRTIRVPIYLQLKKTRPSIIV